MRPRGYAELLLTLISYTSVHQQASSQILTFNFCWQLFVDLYGCLQMKKSELQAIVSDLPDDVDVRRFVRQLSPHEDSFASTYFRDVKPVGWELDTDRGFDSGQSSLCFVRHVDSGVKGVFKCLKPKASNVEKQRLKRELAVLCDRVNHPNVVKPLDVGDLWLITPRGIELEKWWHQFTSENDAPRIEIVSVSIVRSIALGLRACHAIGLIHRDVKLANIVMVAGAPVLIDFGLVDDPDGAELTRDDEPIGNRICSHDIARFRSDECPPWGDIFSLCQVFQQLLLSDGHRQGMRWARPVHWNYISYREGISDEFARSLRAISATCSLEDLCPKDADSFIRLMDKLFPQSREGGDSQSVSAATQALSAYRKMEADQMQLNANETEVIQASLILAEKVVAEICHAVVEIIHHIDPSLVVRHDLATVHEKFPLRRYLENKHSFDCAEVVLTVSVAAEADANRATLSIAVAPLRPTRDVVKDEHGNVFNMFRMEFYFGALTRQGGTLSGNGSTIPGDFLYLAFTSNGELWEFERSFSKIKRTLTVAEICKLSANMLMDQSLWALLPKL